MIAKLAIVVSFLLLGSIVLNYFLFQKLPPQSSPFPFLSSRIFASNQNDILINFVNLRDELRNYVNGVKDPLGLYFEYLPSGVSIGVNDKQEFILVSLLKVPVVMAVYRNVEQEET